MHSTHSLRRALQRQHCRTLIAGYKVLRSVEFVGALPTSGVAKILKRELRKHTGKVHPMGSADR